MGSLVQSLVRTVTAGGCRPAVSFPLERGRQSLAGLLSLGSPSWKGEVVREVRAPLGRCCGRGGEGHRAHDPPGPGAGSPGLRELTSRLRRQRPGVGRSQPRPQVAKSCPGPEVVGRHCPRRGSGPPPHSAPWRPGLGCSRAAGLPLVPLGGGFLEPIPRLLPVLGPCQSGDAGGDLRSPTCTRWHVVWGCPLASQGSYMVHV